MDKSMIRPMMVNNPNPNTNPFSSNIFKQIYRHGAVLEIENIYSDGYGLSAVVMIPKKKKTTPNSNPDPSPDPNPSPSPNSNSNPSPNPKSNPNPKSKFNPKAYSNRNDNSSLSSDGSNKGKS